MSEDKKIVAIGGMPNGCSDRTARFDNPLENKTPFVCHAEMNAIISE